MTRTIRCLPVALLVSIATASEPATPPATPPSASSTLLVPGQNEGEWSPLFAALAAQGAIRSTFTEYRWFSVRKEPVVLKGELRYSPSRGLSLCYSAPERQIMIIDERGVVLRNAKGRSREMPADAKSVRIDAMLLPVMRFDLPALSRHFELHATREGQRWKLDFVPRTPAVAKQLSTLSVQGEGSAVRRLEFRRAANQRVEVVIESTEQQAVFSPVEEKEFFR